jgi:SAM-dependent methyltransferase
MHPPLVFDRRAVRCNRTRAAACFAAHDFLFRAGAERLADRLADIARGFPLAFEIGARGRLLADRLPASAGIECLIASDVALPFARGCAAPAAVADEEFLVFAEGRFDLALGNLALHWTNDLPGALHQVARALKPDGLLLASMLGGRTLVELRECLLAAESEVSGGSQPRVSPFVEIRDAGALLQRAGFALPVVDADLLTVTYPDALALMRELRAMGEANALVTRTRRFTRRTVLLRGAELYAERFAGADGRIRASFEILTLTAWAPAASQTKPLRPGSAAARLADALGTTERSAGEKAAPRG